MDHSVEGRSRVLGTLTFWVTRAHGKGNSVGLRAGSLPLLAPDEPICKRRTGRQGEEDVRGRTPEVFAQSAGVTITSGKRASCPHHLSRPLLTGFELNGRDRGHRILLLRATPFWSESGTSPKASPFICFQIKIQCVTYKNSYRLNGRKTFSTGTDGS